MKKTYKIENDKVILTKSEDHEIDINELLRKKVLFEESIAREQENLDAINAEINAIRNLGVVIPGDE